MEITCRGCGYSIYWEAAVSRGWKAIPAGFFLCPACDTNEPAITASSGVGIERKGEGEPCTSCEHNPGRNWPHPNIPPQQVVLDREGWRNFYAGIVLGVWAAYHVPDSLSFEKVEGAMRLSKTGTPVAFDQDETNQLFDMAERMVREAEVRDDVFKL